jgi:hypothetical protein
VLALCTTAEAVEFAGGTGEPNNPYQIATAEQLIAIGADPNLLSKHFILVADIDLDPNRPGGRVFDRAVIGTDTTSFSGSFDGCGRTIANLHIIGQYYYMPVRSISVSADSTEDTRLLLKSHYIGLFRMISPEGFVSNLNLRDVRIDGGRFVAPLAVENQGVIINCRVEGVVNGVQTVGGLVATNRGFVVCCHTDIEMTLSPAPGVASTGQSGGLIGYHQNGLVTHCSARGRITGSNQVGGLIGEYWAQVTHCWAAVDITTPSLATTSPGSGIRTLADNVASGRSLGGLVGYCGSTSSLAGLQDCYAVGSITAGPSSSYIGGLAVQLFGSSAHCYAATKIVVGEASRWVGGLAGTGSSNPANWQGCFFLDPNDGGGPDNKIGTPLTDAQMRRRDSFTGWDFFGDAADGTDDPWFMPEGSYPILTGQTEVTGLIHVPDLRGIKLDAALALIESLGLTVGEVTEDCDKDVALGRVLDVTPRGTPPKGSVVRVAVSTGAYRWEENPGDGSPSNPYQIQSRGQFLDLGRHPELYGKCFVLMCDIDLGDQVFQQSPIAPNVTGETYEFKGTPFSGCFDGGMHTISNLTITSATPRTAVSHMGLFGCATADSKISRLRIENARINHSGTLRSSGLLCGESQGEIRDCHAGGKVSYGTYTGGVGGLVGVNRGFVTRSTAEATLFFVDPTVAQSQSLAAADSDSIKIMRGTPPGRDAPRELGVLIGINYGIVTDCYARGSVTGSKYSSNMAGIVGVNSWSDGLVASCYCVATVCSDKTFTGVAVNGTGVMNCYYLRDPALPDAAYGSGVGLTDAEMRQQASFVGFDFVGSTEDGTTDTWVMPQDGGYPVLADERPFDLAGQGTEAEPYLVGSVLDMGLILQGPDAHYRLTCDIDYSSIASPAVIIPWFSGTLDGSGHKISGIVRGTSTWAGLLGSIQKQAEVRDLQIERIEITGTESSLCMGALACLNHGRILNCSVTGRITGSGTIGGLAAKNDGTVYACRTDVAVTGVGRYNSIGGLLGGNSSGIVAGCQAAGAVVGGPDGGSTGGLIGWQTMGGTLWTDVTLTAYCCSTGSVAGATYTGGLIGHNSARVAYCLAAGPVRGGSQTGGLAGYVGQGTISHCYFLDPNDGGGPDNGFGQPLSAAQIAAADNFVEWDFIERTFDGIADAWSLPAGAPYPLPSALNTDVLPELEGTGSPDAPYLIRSATDFCAMSRHPSACYRLDADVDLGAVYQNCPPIPLLVGHLDGAGHSITGLALASSFYGGFLGVIDSGASVRNLIIADANIVGVEEGYALGILAGANQGDVIDCRVEGTVRGNMCLAGLTGVCFGPLSVSGCSVVVSIFPVPLTTNGGRIAGGLVGWSDDASFSDSCASVTIVAGDHLEETGGVAGQMDGAINRCFATGTIRGGVDTWALAGLAGEMSNATIRDSYADVDITTGAEAHYVGGLIGGYILGGRVEYCYSRGAISVGERSEKIAGLIADGPLAKSCFWDTQTSGLTWSDSGSGRTTADMQKAQTYKQAGWDFANAWMICEGKDYPHLQWEQVECK